MSVKENKQRQEATTKKIMGIEAVHLVKEQKIKLKEEKEPKVRFTSVDVVIIITLTAWLSFRQT